MSGFIAIIHTDGRPADPSACRQMVAGLRFRGPDGQAVWSSDNVAFGHALARTTFEAESEHQPCSLDGHVWIAGDMRIDGREDLLRRLGIPASPQAAVRLSDPELMLHAYRRWDSDCVRYLLGDFAFAIWDGRRRRLFCARDHFGVKPFYFAHVDRSLIISNAVATIRKYPAISGRIDEHAISDFLLFGMNRHLDRTAFADIQRLPPSHTLIWSEGKSIRCSRYWRLSAPSRLRYRRPQEVVDQFLDRMRGAVVDRMRTRRVGILMSGGLDSTSVAALALEEQQRRPDTYELRAGTFYYDKWIVDDEIAYAAQVAEKLGIPFYPVNAAEERLVCGPDALRKWQPEPIPETTTGAAIEKLKTWASGYRVVLTGQGGDPLLDPAPMHCGAFFTHLLLGRLGWDLLAYWLTNGRFPRFGLRSSVRHWMGRPAAQCQREYPPWLDPTLQRRLELRHRWTGQLQADSSFRTMRSGACHLTASPIWTCLFEGLDFLASDEAVEIRHPFFDLRVVSFLLTLPPVPWCVEKTVLRRAMDGRLPDSVLQRPKAPLAGFPIYEQLKQTDLNGFESFCRNSGISDYIDLERYVKMLRHPEKLRPFEYVWLTRPMGLAMWLSQPSSSPTHSR